MLSQYALRFLACGAVLAAAVTAEAASACQPLTVEDATQRIRDYVKVAMRSKDLSPVEADFDLFLLAVAEGLRARAGTLEEAEEAALANLIVEQETRRTDKQLGASARSEGTTTLAEKSGFPLLLGMALESGAVQKSVNGTVLTLSTTPYALVTTTTGDTAQAYREYAILRHFAASASFRIADAAQPLESVQSKQLAEWSIRTQLTRDHSARSASTERLFRTKYAAAVAAPAVAATRAMRELFPDGATGHQRNRARQKAVAAAVAEAVLLLEAAAPDAEAIERSISCGLRREVADQIATFAIPDDLVERFRDEIPAALKVARGTAAIALGAFQDELDVLQRKPQVTLAYSNIRPEDGAAYSVGKLVVDYRPSAPLALALNAGLSLYHSPDPAKKQERIRDYAASIALEGNGGRSPFLRDPGDRSRVTFSLSARYQRLVENGGVEGKRADLLVGQVKVEFPLASGVTFPMSVSWANATELIAESDVRAHFGFTLDTDKLLLLAR